MCTQEGQREEEGKAPGCMLYIVFPGHKAERLMARTEVRYGEGMDWSHRCPKDVFGYLVSATGHC